MDPNSAKKRKTYISIGIVILIILAIYLYKSQSPSAINTISPGEPTESYAQSSDGYAMGKASIGMGIRPPVMQDAAPAPDVKNRLVVQESSVSLQVADVDQSTQTILQYIKQQGGYMVNQSMQGSKESPSGTLIVRIPQEKLSQALQFFKDNSLQVVSENLTGEDVTDQYVDNDARLQTLEQTKQKFQELMDRAKEISDITNLTQQIINIQSQIDAIKGQQIYLEKSAQMARVTIYLSTDDLALPYAPDNAWRPSVIFKQAVRALVLQLRGMAEWVIWASVYAVIWIPVGLIAIYIYKKFMK